MRSRRRDVMRGRETRVQERDRGEDSDEEHRDTDTEDGLRNLIAREICRESDFGYAVHCVICWPSWLLGIAALLSWVVG
jgi:hypothetical protein